MFKSTKTFERLSSYMGANGPWTEPDKTWHEGGKE